ncbi:hypothetical protein EV1_030418 [Malus domestica]
MDWDLLFESSEFDPAKKGLRFGLAGGSVGQRRHVLAEAGDLDEDQDGENGCYAMRGKTWNKVLQRENLVLGSDKMV